jgi:hypothetical protein
MNEAVRRELSDIGLRNRFAGAILRVKEEAEPDLSPGRTDARGPFGSPEGRQAWGIFLKLFKVCAV